MIQLSRYVFVDQNNSLLILYFLQLKLFYKDDDNNAAQTWEKIFKHNNPKKVTE